MDLHLVDATYELFRAHFSPRPPVRGRDGLLLTGVAGLVGTLLTLLRDRAALVMAFVLPTVIFSIFAAIFSGAIGDRIRIDANIAERRAH